VAVETGPAAGLLLGHFQAPAAPAPPPGPNAGKPASVIEERRASPADLDRDLFDRYVAAKRARGEDVSGYRLEGFLEGLERERRKVREKFGDSDIAFEVAERDGRVRLIAKKKSRGEA